MHESRRPGDNRPQSRPEEVSEDLDRLLAELAQTRTTYDDLRTRGGSLGERADMRGRLHHLRAEIAGIRCCHIL